MRVILRTLWSSIKEVKAPFVFDMEHGIALEAMQGTRASSRGEVGNLMVFLELQWNLRFPLGLQRGCYLNTRVFSAASGLLPRSRDNSGLSSSHGRAVGTPLQLRRETQGPFPVATGILLFLSIFKRSQPSSPVEACNSTFLLRCQRGVKPPVEMRRGTKAFSMVSTGDSDIPSCCNMEEEHAFKSLQGNSALFQVRAYRCPFH